MLKQNARKNNSPPKPNLKELMAMLGLGIQTTKPFLMPLKQPK